MGRREGKSLCQVCNICNGLFYSSDLSADAELMAAEISRGNETIGTNALRNKGGGMIERERERERKSVCVCICVKEREKERVVKAAT